MKAYLAGAALVFAAGAWAQTPSALLPAPEVNLLCQRSTQLMEAGGIAIPGLSRAADPVVENVRQACGQIQRQPNAGQATYDLIMNIRAYLALAEAVPKPFPFPEEARKQLAELRDNAARLDSHFRAALDDKDKQLRSPDPDNLARYAEANRKLGPPQPGRPRVVFLGDSTFEQWRLNEYFPDRNFINRGIDAQTTGELLGRMMDDVINLHPEAVVILGGTVDINRGVPLAAIEDNYVMLADLAAANKIKPVFASVLPVSDYHRDANPTFERTKTRSPVDIKTLDDWLASFCSQRGYPYLNYFAALVDAQGQFGADLSDDGLHPNAKGYRLMAPLTLEGAARAAAKTSTALVVGGRKPKQRTAASK